MIADADAGRASTARHKMARSIATRPPPARVIDTATARRYSCGPWSRPSEEPTMRTRLLFILFLVVLAPATSVRAADPYYLALGDSLAVGIQPGSLPTNQGYADDLYAFYHARNPSLRLEKLGCSGETT